MSAHGSCFKPRLEYDIQCKKSRKRENECHKQRWPKDKVNVTRGCD